MKAMKKLLSLFAAVVAVMLSSCSNDDIPMASAVTVKVDPSTVVSSFVESEVADLTTFTEDSGAKLRIRLLVYDEQGKFVTSEYVFSQDYLHIKNFNLNLPEGKYTMVAVTDVVGNDGFEIYKLDGQDKLSTLTLTYVQDNDFGKFSILGLTVEKQDISSSNRVFSIKVKPAGALITCYIANWNDCTNHFDSDGDRLDIVSYGCLSKSSNGQLSLDKSGDFMFSNKVPTPGYYFSWGWFERDEQYQNAYHYTFKFCEENVLVLWRGVTSKDQVIDFKAKTVNIELGKHYRFELDMSDLSCLWYDYNEPPKRIDPIRPIVPINPDLPDLLKTRNTIMMDKAINFFDQSISMPTNEGKSIKPIDYLKQ